MDPPPSLERHKYSKDYDEVRKVGGMNSLERPQDRADVARFFAVVPPSLWNMVAAQIAATHRLSLAETARAFALVNMAMLDASIATFDTKYHYNFWRPETAIRAGDADGIARTEGDPSFVPFITTPCFPSYPSAHAALSGAAREVLERLFGRRPRAITLSTPAVPGVTLHYTRLKEITDDIDDARVYGGIHFRFDQEAGTEQGRRVGAYVYEHNLRPARECSCRQDDLQK
ncbi:MAG: vanadium-dependent haloperoxidase [Vicinamibacterales bacterium]